MNRRDMLKAVAVAPFVAAFGNTHVAAEGEFAKAQKWLDKNYVVATDAFDLEEIFNTSHRGLFGEWIEFKIERDAAQNHMLVMTVTDIPHYCDLSRYENYKSVYFSELREATNTKGGVEVLAETKQYDMTNDWLMALYDNTIGISVAELEYTYRKRTTS